MKDKKLKKLKKELSKLGIDEEKQKEILDIINSDDEDVEEDDAEIVEEESAEEVKPDGDNEGKGDEETPAEEVPAPEVPPEEPAAEEDVPPAPLPEGTEEVDPSQIGNEEPPVLNTDEVPNPAPVDNTVELETKIAKQEELITALQAKIDSLSEALQNAGILKADATNQVGVDDNQTPANNPIDDPLGDVLAEINGRR